MCVCVCEELVVLGFRWSDYRPDIGLDEWTVAAAANTITQVVKKLNAGGTSNMMVIIKPSRCFQSFLFLFYVQ